mmetsp:Transcript_16655/g.40826  ORF Transcript_16655/g.40826 Transcript_16655/m.40826 type:complete len:676 (-) Transcript_16655:727-2754(-)
MSSSPPPPPHSSSSSSGSFNIPMAAARCSAPMYVYDRSSEASLRSRRRGWRNPGVSPGQLARLRYARAGAPAGSAAKKPASRLRQKVQSAAVRCGQRSAAVRSAPHPVRSSVCRWAAASSRRSRRAHVPSPRLRNPSLLRLSSVRPSHSASSSLCRRGHATSARRMPRHRPRSSSSSDSDATLTAVKPSHPCRLRRRSRGTAPGACPVSATHSSGLSASQSSSASTSRLGHTRLTEVSASRWPHSNAVAAVERTSMDVSAWHPSRRSVVRSGDHRRSVVMRHLLRDTTRRRRSVVRSSTVHPPSSSTSSSSATNERRAPWQITDGHRSASMRRSAGNATPASVTLGHRDTTSSSRCGHAPSRLRSVSSVVTLEWLASSTRSSGQPVSASRSCTPDDSLWRGMRSSRSAGVCSSSRVCSMPTRLSELSAGHRTVSRSPQEICTPGTARWPTLSACSSGWLSTRLLDGFTRKSAAAMESVTSAGNMVWMAASRACAFSAVPSVRCVRCLRGSTGESMKARTSASGTSPRWMPSTLGKRVHSASTVCMGTCLSCTSMTRQKSSCALTWRHCRHTRAALHRSENCRHDITWATSSSGRSSHSGSSASPGAAGGAASASGGAGGGGGAEIGKRLGPAGRPERRGRCPRNMTGLSAAACPGGAGGAGDTGLLAPRSPPSQC